MPAANPYEAPASVSHAGDSVIHTTPGGDIWWLLFSFRGRANRWDYWKGIFITVGLFIAGGFVSGAVEEFVGSDIASVPQFTAGAVAIWSYIAVTIKRWHDRGKGGHWMFIYFVPLIGGLWHFIEVGCLPGTVGPNRFGGDGNPIWD